MRVLGQVMIGLDRELVTEGYPTKEGLHFLWSNHSGWPVIDVVRVQVTDTKVTWWRGVDGTDRRTEVASMFRFGWTKYLGSSRITPEVLAHYETLWIRTSEEVKTMLSKGTP